MLEHMKNLLTVVPGKGKESSMRQKALKGFAAFLTIMIAFTFLSRAADAMTLARVTTGKMEKKAIDRSVSADGSFEKNQEIPVVTIENLLIESVNVSAGSAVNTGDVLFRVSRQYLEEQINILQNEINVLATSISETEYNNSLAEGKRSTAISQAKEDYNTEVNSQNTKVNRAYQEMIDAQNAIAAFDAQNHDESENPTAARAELVTDYNNKKEAYEDAVEGRDSSLREKQKQIDAASEANDKNTSALQESKLTKQKKEEELTKLRALADAGGEVYAPADGVVTEVLVVPGDLTPATKAVLLADTSEGLVFTAQITKEERKYISAGDAAVLTLGDGTVLDNLTVDRLTENADNSSVYDVRIVVASDSVAAIGDSASLKIDADSNSYATCVPVAALHEENGEHFLYTIKKTEGVLGTESSVEKQKVTIKEKNNTYAALENGSIEADQEFIIESSKEIAEGDRIRLEENE